MGQPDFKPLENRLQRISRRFISIKKDVDTAYRQHFDNVSQYLVDRMKNKDKLFEQIFQVLQLAGSTADGIKVEAPNEFDVLVLLKFPKPIPVGSDVPGYVTINIKDGINTWLGRITGYNDEEIKKYKRFTDSEYYLIQDQILDWLRVLVKEILSDHRNILKIAGAEYIVQQRNSGPAVTMDVNVRGAGHFSIDFVAALQFQSNDKWVADKQRILIGPRFWNAIPKPNKMRLHKNREWICSYAEIERDFLNGLNRLKPLIRIFKKIRDKASLTNLKSYYIKTIFLHRRLQMANDYWNASLAILFMEMFDVILEHLRTKTLWSLWHNNYNLFSQLDDYQILDVYNNLKCIKEKIVKNLINNNPDIIYAQILKPNEMRAMEEKEIVEEMERAKEQSWCTIL